MTGTYHPVGLILVIWKYVGIDSSETLSTMGLTDSQLQFCLGFFLGIVQFFPKAAIFLMYRELFRVYSNAVHISIWLGLIFTFLTNASHVPVSLAFLAPHYGEDWNDVLVRLSAHSSGPQYLLLGPIQGAVSVILDIYIFILPLPIIYHIILSPRKKIQLLLFFSTALL